jgi:hypothetical protein
MKPGTPAAIVSHSRIGVVRGFGRAADLDRRLVDHVLVGFGVTLLVLHVPAERLEERVDDLLAEHHLFEVG